MGSSFEYYAAKFAKAGIASIGFDYRGFGRSEGLRGYIRKHEDTVADFLSFLQLAKQKDGELMSKPLFLLGVAYGATTALDLSIRKPDLFNGMILVSPYLGIGDEPFVLLSYRNE